MHTYKFEVHPGTYLEGPGNRGIAVPFLLTSAIDRVDGQHHTPASLSLGKRACAHSTGDFIGPKSGLDG